MPDLHKVYVNRTFECAAEKLFDWFTQPERIVQWFGPQGFSVENVQTELKVGGHYRITLKKPNDTRFTVLGKYTQISRPTTINFTYRYEDLAVSPPPSMVKISLKVIDQKTTAVSLVQEFELMPADMEGRTKAWNHMLSRLALLLD